jgi:hypothetical protein
MFTCGYRLNSNRLADSFGNTKNLSVSTSGKQKWSSGKQKWSSGNQKWSSGKQKWSSGNQEWSSGKRDIMVFCTYPQVHVVRLYLLSRKKENLWNFMLITGCSLWVTGWSLSLPDDHFRLPDDHFCLPDDHSAYRRNFMLTGCSLWVTGCSLESYGNQKKRPVSTSGKLLNRFVSWHELTDVLIMYEMEKLELIWNNRQNVICY